MIDVLIPAFNAERTIQSAVESILHQSKRDIRVLVIDDGSTDRTSEIIAQMARSDKRLEIITTVNRGIVDALNTGLSHCRAKIIARHDADDIAYPNRFAQQQAYLDANPNCIAVGASAWHIDEAGRRVGSVRYSGDAEGDARRIPAGEPYLLHPFLMVRRSAMEAISGYRHVFHAEDTDLYWRLKPIGRLHNLEEILGEYRVHAGSITNRSVLNARIGALNAQLAAISAVRRSGGRADITFDRNMLGAYQAAESLERMVNFASTQLDPDEKSYLEVATAAKMIELRNYRKFRFTNEDRAYVANAFYRHRRLLTWPTRTRIIHQIMHLVRPKVGLRRLALQLSSLRPTSVR
jgi:glycosyltransferase involved in cell wall biosynthesis